MVDDGDVEDNVERVLFVTGLWSEGVLKGSLLVLPPAFVIAVAVGLTMGFVRLGSRSAEALFRGRGSS